MTITRPIRISRSPRPSRPEAINDIANSPYWSQSAIIITYDETDGFYDHVSPAKRSTFADGSILEAGPRIPTIVISPYAAAGKISHRYSEHGSVIKFINELKGLVPLAVLPDEATWPLARQEPISDQDNLGPSDDPDNNVGDLTGSVRLREAEGRRTADPGFGRRSSLDGDQEAATSGDAELFEERLHERRLRSDRHPADRLRSRRL